jgi:hypothetical protein
MVLTGKKFQKFADTLKIGKIFQIFIYKYYIIFVKKPLFLIFSFKKTKIKPFRNEILLINGFNISKSIHPSIIHFSLNKSATQQVKNILYEIANLNQLVPIGIHDYAFCSNYPFLDKVEVKEFYKYSYIFKPKGYIYSVFGGYIEGIPNIDKFLKIIMIRDPRDILVSLYYSTAFSHSVPTGDKKVFFLSERKKTIEQNIDEFVIEKSHDLLGRLSKYRILLETMPSNTLLTYYEKMVNAPQEWLDELLYFSKFKVDENLKNLIIGKIINSIPVSESIHSHNRKGVCGDYKTKLTEETVEKLNSIFYSELKYFDYCIH